MLESGKRSKEIGASMERGELKKDGTEKGVGRGEIEGAAGVALAGGFFGENSGSFVLISGDGGDVSGGLAREAAKKNGVTKSSAVTKSGASSDTL